MSGWIRSFEFFICIIFLTLFIPVFLLISVIVIIETGSAFFVQKRVGFKEREFHLIKFRTMKVDTEDMASHLISKQAITKSGKFLRKSKLDELPQLINVLMGTMSLVGPRPCLPNQKELVQERRKKGVFNVLPGITGIAQINKVDMSDPKKLAELDRIWVFSRSTKLYFYCLFATLVGKGFGDTIE